MTAKTVLNLSNLNFKKKRTESEPHGIYLHVSDIFRYLRTLHIVWSLVKLGVSPGSKLCTMFLNIAKHGENWHIFNLPEPERNRVGNGTVNVIMCSTVTDRKRQMTAIRRVLQFYCAAICPMPHVIGWNSSVRFSEVFISIISTLFYVS